MKIKLKPLAEQVIVITGASSGIGLVTARRAAAAGAKVMLVARSEPELREIVGEITQAGGVADCFGADVGDAAAVQAAAAHAVQRFGRIDTWVNDAGTTIYATLMETPLDEHQQLFRTNYFGVVNGCTAAVPHFKSGGALITVASIASDIPSPIMGAYSASKHAVKAYVEILRIELGNEGLPISVSLVKPSGIDTPIGQHAEVHVEGEAQIPPVIYAPELVADAILHCAATVRREITVGGFGRLGVLFGQHFKTIYEAISPSDPAHLTDKSKKQPKPSNLFQGAHAGRERSGGHVPKSFSLYTSAAKHPRATVLGLSAVIAGASVLLFRGSGKTPATSAPPPTTLPPAPPPYQNELVAVVIEEELVTLN